MQSVYQHRASRAFESKIFPTLVSSGFGVLFIVLFGGNAAGELGLFSLASPFIQLPLSFLFCSLSLYGNIMGKRGFTLLFAPFGIVYSVYCATAQVAAGFSANDVVTVTRLEFDLYSLTVSALFTLLCTHFVSQALKEPPTEAENLIAGLLFATMALVPVIFSYTAGMHYLQPVQIASSSGFLVFGLALILKGSRDKNHGNYFKDSVRYSIGWIIFCGVLLILLSDYHRSQSAANLNKQSNAVNAITLTVNTGLANTAQTVSRLSAERDNYLSQNAFEIALHKQLPLLPEFTNIWLGDRHGLPISAHKNPGIVVSGTDTKCLASISPKGLYLVACPLLSSNKDAKQWLVGAVDTAAPYRAISTYQFDNVMAVSLQPARLGRNDASLQLRTIVSPGLNSEDTLLPVFSPSFQRVDNKASELILLTDMLLVIIAVLLTGHVVNRDLNRLFLHHIELQQANPIALITTTREGQVLTANPAAATIFGTHLNSLTDSDVLELGLDDLALQSSKQTSSIVHRPNGTDLPVDFSVTGISLPDMQPGWLLTASDISVQAKFSSQIQAQLKLTKSLLDSASEGIVGVDEIGNITLNNPASRRILLYKDGASGPTSIYDHIAVYHRDKLRHQLHHGTTEPVLIDILRADGSTFTGRMTVSSASDDDIHQNSLILFHDASDELQREEIAKTQLVNLKRVNAELNQLSFIVNHDLGEPLRTISIYNELAIADLENNDAPAATIKLNTVNDASSKLQLLYQGLKKITAAQNPPSGLEVLPLQTVFSRLGYKYTSIIMAGGGALHFEGGQIEASFDTDSITTALSQLIDNAIKFKGDDPLMVRVAATETASNVEIRVMDNGRGIDEEYKEIVFQAFHRLQVGDKNNASGVGLTIARRIIDHHQGDICVEYGRGKGTTFLVKLPKQRNGDTKDV